MDAGEEGRTDSARDELVNPTRRLPDLRLAGGPGGAPTPVRARGRRSPVLVLVHPSPCADCAKFVAELETSGESLLEWDGHPVVVAPEPWDDARDTWKSGGLPLLADPEERLAAALGVRAPAVLVADQWGEVHEAREAGEEHHFPTIGEIVSTLSYLAVRCPECQGEAL
jgi:hypothetical protein